MDFLPSVVEYSEKDGAAVYVADNGSTDSSVEAVKKNFPSVRLITFPENYGFAEGYNKAIAAVEEEYVVLLNSDVEVTEHWLRPMTAYLDAHPEVAACQPKIRSWRQRELFEYAGASGGFIDRYGYPFCRGRIFDRVEADKGQYDEVSSIFWATGAALFIRREVYNGVGGLDGTFFAHMEEIDLCWRLKARGYQIVCIPDSVVYHVGAATLKKESPRKTFLNFRNNLLMLYKNLPDVQLKRVMRMRTVLDYVAMLPYLLKGDWSNARAVRKARREFAALKENYRAKREENLRRMKVETIKEIYPRLLLTDFMIRGRKLFSQLKF